MVNGIYSGRVLFNYLFILVLFGDFVFLTCVSVLSNPF